MKDHLPSLVSGLNFKSKNFYTPPDPNGIGGFFALKNISKNFFKKIP